MSAVGRAGGYAEIESPAAFRERVRSWLHDNVDLDKIDSLSTADRRSLTGRLYDAGMIGLTWPSEYGGRALGAEYQTIFNEETSRYTGAFHNASVTVGICAATLLDRGTDEQKRRHIPAMLRADEEWTQLLSEPGAGSDLASVGTRARHDGDMFVISGQKVWTSLATESDYALALVRTDVTTPRHGGLSMLIVELSTPGIEVRPLREMTGASLFSEVFIDEARVPVANLVGELNGGWSVLNTMLTHERISLSAGTTGRRMDEDAFPRLLELARDRGNLDAADVRTALIDVYVQQRLLDYTGMRIREAIAAGALMGPVGSLGKVGTAKAARAAAEAGMLIGGAEALAWSRDDTRTRALATTLLHFPMTGIAGGTTEIQKNVIAERLLGLPR